jgi:predicted RNA-binding Zn-ribbon protein involved in translation (DUF1610 family)
MSAENKFGLLRKMLRALGLSQEAADDVVNFILDLLAGDSKKAQNPEFPYHLRDKFLSPAELSFYNVLREVVGNQAVLLTKVSLGDVFWVKKDDPSRYRIYTNKIDRKHVDFLICDSITIQPIIGIELDDKSHQRPDRQERDAFVDQVFKAAGLPILHIPAKRSYVAQDLEAQLAPFLNGSMTFQNQSTKPITKADFAKIPASNDTAMVCPKCGNSMVLRTSKSGANAGNRFWGCSNYPSCRSMLPYQE